MNVLVAVFLVVTSAIIAQAELPHDRKNNAELADTIKAELQPGQFDLLESIQAMSRWAEED